jgi:hypothetical protein
VSKKGDPSKEWLKTAQEAQEAAEVFCGTGAYKVQRISDKELEMARTKAKETKETKEAKESKKVVPVTRTLNSIFTPVKILYEESAEAPRKLPTDSYKIWKEIQNGEEVWVSENGLIFKVDSSGDIGEFVRRNSPKVST